jgi:hypothetical protein
VWCNTPCNPERKSSMISYYQQDHTIRECSAKFSMSTTTVRKYAKEAGVLRTPEESYVLRDSKADNGPRWKGGRSLRYKPGYMSVYTGVKNGISTYRTEHLLISERVLGRRLRCGEVVHHINGDKLDNRNCNLLLCSNPYHGYLHQKMAKLYQQEHFDRR